MTKVDLIEILAKKETLKHREAYIIVNMIFDGFTETLKKGSRIELRGFGSFSVRNYGAYIGKNPKNGKKVQVGSKRLPYFKVGKVLKERVDISIN
jgi:integration host factor subunit beta